MTTRRQRSRAAQHRHDLAVREARRQVGAVVAETRPQLPEQLRHRPVRKDAKLVLHYRGDRTSVDPARIYGPDTAGASYRATGATYDPYLDRTTLSFRPISPAVAS